MLRKPVYVGFHSFQDEGAASLGTVMKIPIIKEVQR
jgi:hypothetical protein